MVFLKWKSFRRIGEYLSVLSLLPVFAVIANAQPFAYVANQYSAAVSVIDTATNSVVATIPVGNDPVEVAITPDGTRAYVTNQVDSTVSVINTATNTVFTTVPVGNTPTVIAITPDGTRAYVPNQGDNTVSVINTASNTVVATVPAGNVPIGVAITPDGTLAYVTNRIDNTVSVINTATNTVLTTVPVGTGPVGVAITPDGTLAYVANFSGTTVSVIATATNTVGATVPEGINPIGVAITPDGTRAYVTNAVSTNVSVIATATNTVVATVGVGSDPTGVAITPDGTLAYVANFVGGTISVLATATNTVVATVPVGIGPIGLAITPPPPTARTSDTGFQTHYSTNLNVGESYIDITNDGANGASLLGPGFGAAAGNLCVNVYAFDPNEELVSCCSCLVTPDQTVNLGVNADLTSNTLTGLLPTSVTVKLVATLAGTGGAGTGMVCNNSAAGITGTTQVVRGMAAWGTTLHQTPTGAFATTETPFTPAAISTAELSAIVGRCAAIIGNASGFGICTSCRSSALAAPKF